MKLSIICAPILRGKAFNRPIAILIETSAVCNLHCRGCPVPHRYFQKSRKSKFIKPKDVQKILSLVEIDGKRHCDTFVVNNFGEPFLNLDFLSILDILSSYFIIFSTNLNVRSEHIDSLIAYHEKYRNISELIVSMDGYDQGSYENFYRIGGSWDKIINNIQKIERTALREVTQLQLLDNGDQEFRERFIAFAKEHRFATRIKPLDASFKKDGTALYTTNKCHFSYQGIYIDSDCNIVSCCADPMMELKNANVYNCQSWSELWNGEAIKKRRLALSKNKNLFDVCRQCQGLNLITSNKWLTAKLQKMREA
ncbi:MAG: radical SAM protein [Helicobacteraceae bacterium]|jgi:organic radical activating enzyme|nr:radical SAM protein [Helicobacteraceae bacterium]